jgi:hypothetical protein
MTRRVDTPATDSVPVGSGWYPTALARLGHGGVIERRAVEPRVSKTEVADLLAAIEREVEAAPEECFTFDGDGVGTLRAAGQSFCAGSFETPAIGELRERVASRGGGGKLRLSALRGAHALTDIGTLQATAAPNALFQVASQFNCLEAPGPRVVPVRKYVHDNTQGPRASVSAFPATFLRHYRAPAANGTRRFVQKDGECVNLLSDVFDSSAAEVQSGYLQIGRVRQPETLGGLLTERFELIRVGVHDQVEVVFGHDWGGPVPGAPHHRIAQIFTSTIALGGYGHDDGSPSIAVIRRQLLRAAYLGTLLAAIDHRKSSVVLTLIGGGVFGNPHRDIWDAIHWALAEADAVADQDVDVIVNTRERIADGDREEVRRRGGAVVEFSGDRIVIDR